LRAAVRIAARRHSQPSAGIVERIFAWLGCYRRLSMDYEALPETSEALIT
jgi:transposase